eukprot:g4407.t1
MSNTILERVRENLEEIDALDRLIVSSLKQSTKTKREQSDQAWKLHDLIQGSIDRSQDVLEIYRDESGFRKEEIEQMSNDNAVDSYYDRLGEIKQFHRVKSRRRFQTQSTYDRLEHQYSEDAKDNLETRFSGEEKYGSCVDLHSMYIRFMNLKRATKKKDDNKEAEDEDDDSLELNYRAYLDLFHRTNAALVDRKEPLVVEDESFRDYLSDLVSYFVSFSHRVEPLMVEELKAEMKVWEQEFENRDPFEAYRSIPGYLDMKSYENVKQLEKLGADVLKAALTALGLKCGGTLTQRAERLLAVKRSGPDNIDPSFLAGAKSRKRRRRRGKNRSAETKKSSSSSSNDNKNKKYRVEIRKMEYLLQKFLEKFEDVIEATKRHVEQKQIRTWEELEKERTETQEAEAILNAEESESDEEEAPYNPKNVPLGWDGKPIPYWMYRLHGLSHEYTCEICGNQSYRGRRAFERHFTEWRHQHGMRCLGIPNTQHFHGITKMEDARKLWAKLQQESTKTVWNENNDEEFEDSDGNVLSKKMHDDLARQGLL